MKEGDNVLCIKTYDNLFLCNAIYKITKIIYWSVNPNNNSYLIKIANNEGLSCMFGLNVTNNDEYDFHNYFIYYDLKMSRKLKLEQLYESRR